MPDFKYILKMQFEWDPNKARKNLEKHGISFEEAITVFDDPFDWAASDLKHSTAIEKREWQIGQSDRGILVIVFTVRQPGTMYRIISARVANKYDRSIYEKRKRIQLEQRSASDT